MADITTLVEYYRNLLIIQYHDKPKAMATIEALAQEMMASGIMLDVLNGFDIETAVGAQLDIIGKYVGVDRFYSFVDPVDYFAVTTYTEVDPDSDQKYGFTTYPDIDGNPQHNGTINYSSVVVLSNQLSDADYRTIIKLKILQNNINHSNKAIDDGVFAIFGNNVVPSSNGDMRIYYFISDSSTALVRAAIAKGLLPRPMAVLLGIIEDVIVPFYGFATYYATPTTVFGFQDYASYGSVSGNILTYGRVEYQA